eukprot:5983868-Pleurochrysis_carterae.AAC.1
MRGCSSVAGAERSVTNCSRSGSVSEARGFSCAATRVLCAASLSGSTAVGVDLHACRILFDGHGARP